MLRQGERLLQKKRMMAATYYMDLIVIIRANKPGITVKFQIVNILIGLFSRPLREIVTTFVRLLNASSFKRVLQLRINQHRIRTNVDDSNRRNDVSIAFSCRHSFIHFLYALREVAFLNFRNYTGILAHTIQNDTSRVVVESRLW